LKYRLLGIGNASCTHLKFAHAMSNWNNVYSITNPFH